MPANVVEGTAAYIRAITGTRTPSELADRMQACGFSWCAIGAVWQQATTGGPIRTGLINTPEKIGRYAAALEKRGIDTFVWGYPWLTKEAEFVTAMGRAMAVLAKPQTLLDPELGANPSKSTGKLAMQKAADGAKKIVNGLRALPRKPLKIGMSTYGIPPRFFPLDAYLDLSLDFVGGQTYKDNATIDKSIALFRMHMDTAPAAKHTQLVPNFGLFSETPTGGVRSKYPEELRSHLYEFVDDPEPIDGMIGWAENFITVKQIPVLKTFSESMRRGACLLPP